MKKTAIIASALAGVIALGGGSAFAANRIAKSNAIGEESARNFAYVDAGVLPEDAENIRTEFDFDSGKFVYDIEFNANGTNYEYTVDSKSGSIIEKDSEALPGYSESETAESKSEPVSASSQAKPAETTNKADKVTGSAETAAKTTQTGDIGVAKAKEIALAKAGLSAKDVSFTKAMADVDDGRQVYDIEFYVKGKFEYEYEIDALTGKIIEESKEPWDASDYIGSEKATSDGKGSNIVASTPTKSQASGATITVDEAKAIALKKAGLTADKVKYTKAKLERDDGKPVYDIEFYVAGQSEYEYEIDAYTGNIIDSDVEPAR